MQAALSIIEQGLKIPERFSFLATRLGAVLLAGLLAALVFQGSGPGSAVAGVFLLPLAAMLPVLRQAWTHALPASLLLLTLLAILGVALEPGFLNLTMAWLMLSALSVALHLKSSSSAIDILAAIAKNYLTAPGRAVRVIANDGELASTKKSWSGISLTGITLGAIALPLVAVMVFGFLLAQANPVLEELVNAFLMGNLLETLFSRGPFVFFTTLGVLWPLLHVAVKQREAVAVTSDVMAPGWHRLFFRPATVVLTLVLLNGMFALENLLDVWHVWLLRELPGNYSHAEYVHRGAYTLVVTAILAAALMIFALWPKSATANSATVQKLVYAWMVQNLLLLASSAKRTLSYIEFYGWTEWRLAGLIWMSLVAFGLATICWRVWQTRDNRWLINANLTATALLLVACGVMDFRGYIANWNADRFLAGADYSKRADLYYMESMGIAALPALYRLRTSDPAFHPFDEKPALFAADYAAIKVIIGRLEGDAYTMQNHWRTWTWRFAGLAIKP